MEKIEKIDLDKLKELVWRLESASNRNELAEMALIFIEGIGACVEKINQIIQKLEEMEGEDDN